MNTEEMKALLDRIQMLSERASLNAGRARSAEATRDALMADVDRRRREEELLTANLESAKKKIAEWEKWAEWWKYAISPEARRESAVADQPKPWQEEPPF